MKTLYSILIALMVVASMGSSASAQQRSKAIKQMSPEEVVTDLYRQHKKQSPFFQTMNRALLDKYFEKEFADLIWKDAMTSKSEVGVIDGDPLFNAQDMDIKKFVVHPADYTASYGAYPSKPRYKLPAPTKASVAVTFENFGQEHSVDFEMSYFPTGWKIWDIRYDDSTQLRMLLEGKH
jgi:IS5 family transposase